MNLSSPRNDGTDELPPALSLQRTERRGRGTLELVDCLMSRWKLASVKGGVYFFRTVPFEEDAEELVSGDRDDQQAAHYAEDESPAQKMSDDIGHETEHVERPLAAWRHSNTVGRADYP
jgi:hypothetical protein